MKISIICPIYNGEIYIKELNKRILNQELLGDVEVEVLYVLTRSKDKSKDILDTLDCKYKMIEPQEYSHSLTREQAAKEVAGDIIVFISQDIKIANNKWLINLIQPIIEGECEASFSRQIGEYGNIEQYTRERNYPKFSRIVTKADIDKYQIRTFFYSDASSAILSKIYWELGAYDGKHMLTNEDMYLAYKLINKGYRIKYAADSCVYHSHRFTMKQLYKRYYDTGVFFKQNPYFLDYKSNESGIDLAAYVFKRSLQDKNFKTLFEIIPNFAIRFIGKILGERFGKVEK